LAKELYQACPRGEELYTTYARDHAVQQRATVAAIRFDIAIFLLLLAASLAAGTQ
jgi:hypothetical protein